MIYSILSSLRTLLCAVVVYFFTVYVFTILLCQGIAELTRAEAEALHPDLIVMYDSLPKTIYTLFAAVSNGYSWNDVILPLRKLAWFYPSAIMLYIALVIFGVSNVVTSVFVDSAIMTSQFYKELIADEKAHLRDVALKHIADVFAELDANGSGEISIDE